MINTTIAYYKEMGERAVQTLLSLDCKQCIKCKRWMSEEFIVKEEMCNECVD